MYLQFASKNQKEPDDLTFLIEKKFFAYHVLS